MNWVEIIKGFVIVVGIAWLTGFAVSAFLMATAPEGRDDEDGFHQL